jgi:hypothetical protein
MDTKPAIVAELERVYTLLNDGLFNGKLQSVPILIQPKKKITLRWLPDQESLVVGSDFTKLANCEIPAAMLHEMIHIANTQRGLTDVTTNQYHNKYFLQAALDAGLVVIKHKTQGWAITTTVYPRNVVERIYIKKPLKEAAARREAVFASIKLEKAVFHSGRTDLRERIKAEKPAKTYFLKYQCNCPPPHNSIRSGRRPDGPNALNIQCLNCRSKFVCVSDLDGEGETINGDANK